jgi:hypothetical protein
MQNANFVKYLGFTDNSNLIFVQDSAGTIYIFKAVDLSLITNLLKYAKVLDVCSSSNYIVTAVVGKKITILSRDNFVVARTFETKH